MMEILFTLLTRQKTSAAALAERFDISVRSVYRYVEELTIAGVPIDIRQGRGGGMCIPDSYKLPVNFLRREEYRAILDAMQAMRGQIQSKALDAAIDKISCQCRQLHEDTSVTGDILVDSSAWGDHRFRDKLNLLQYAVREGAALEIEYVSRTGEETRRTIEPLVLVYKQNVWYVYARCRKRNDFRLFKAGRIRTARETGERFEKRAFSRDDIPLAFTQETADPVDVKLEISPAALPDVEEWLGVDCIRREKDGRLSAAISLPDDEGLIRKLLSLGTGVKVLSPERVAKQLQQAAERLLGIYR